MPRATESWTICLQNPLALAMGRFRINSIKIKTRTGYYVLSKTKWYIPMNIRELQEQIRELVRRINSKHGHSSPNIISFMKVIEEMGEITKVMLKAEINSRKGDKLQKDEVKEQLGHEISDAIIALISLANDYDIDIAMAIAHKFEVHNARN